MSDAKVKLTTGDGTVIVLENGIVTTPDGKTILVKESMISIGAGELCRTCGNPMTYSAVITPKEPTKTEIYCNKCNPREGV